MKKLLLAVAIVLGWTSVAWAAESAPLTTLRAIHALTNEQAGHALPVAFEATVTYCRAYENTLFVQDGNVAIYVKVPADTKLLPGDRILVEGTTHANFRPDILSKKITVLRHGSLPKAVPATFDELNHAKYDCILVTVHGVVRTADQVLSRLAPVLSTRLNMLTDGGDIDAYLDSDDPRVLTEFLDSEVEVTGVDWGRFDGKYQFTGNNLYVSTLASVKILQRARTNPWSLPVTPMDQIFSGYHVQNLSRRMRVHGTITYYQPGLAIVLQNSSRSMWIETRTLNPLQIGDLADATGFPDAHDGFLGLIHGEVQDSHLPAFVKPLPVTWKQITTSMHIFDLVSIEGTMVTAIREPSQDEYVLVSDGHIFSAIYRHQVRAGALALPPMRQIPLGSRVRVTGVCVMGASNPYNRDVPFNLLLRTQDDITVVAGPSWLSVHNLIRLVILLLAVVVVVGAREWYVERKVRRATAALAYIERRRGCILENINGSHPLAEIVEEITELVSFSLHGAPCWCQIADGAQLGNCPPKLTALRIVHHQIPARTGPPLGTIFAAFNPHAMPCSNERETLSMATELASLAIETRRLYSDLRHRSEFDLLTDIHNRFSLGKHLDAMIEEARRKAGIFGLVYIDLDEFKQVNDLYGHQVGDLYLREVALRMKRQLRPGDLLARLGGDEFAALVSVVRSRADVEEIAVRLERCFNDPFALEGYVLHGSASIGLALYPEDGASQDSLLNAADAAMYRAKNIKKHNRQSLSANLDSEFTPTDRT